MKFQRVDERLLETKEVILTKLDELRISGNETLENTKKTNGSVAAIKEWRSFMQGAIAVIVFTLTFVFIPAFGYIFYRIDQIQQEETSAINFFTSKEAP